MVAATELPSCCSCCWLPVEREIGLAPRLIRLSRLPQSGERHVLCSTAGTAIRSAAGVLCIVSKGKGELVIGPVTGTCITRFPRTPGLYAIAGVCIAAALRQYQCQLDEVRSS